MYSNVRTSISVSDSRSLCTTAKTQTFSEHTTEACAPMIRQTLGSYRTFDKCDILDILKDLTLWTKVILHIAACSELHKVVWISPSAYNLRVCVCIMFSNPCRRHSGACIMMRCGLSLDLPLGSFKSNLCTVKDYNLRQCSWNRTNPTNETPRIILDVVRNINLSACSVLSSSTVVLLKRGKYVSSVSGILDENLSEEFAGSITSVAWRVWQTRHARHIEISDTLTQAIFHLASRSELYKVVWKFVNALRS